MDMDGLVELVAVIMGTSMLLIPIAGLTLRFAIKPAVESIALALRSGSQAAAQDPQLDHRLALLEEQVGEMNTTLRRLADVQEFDRQLTETTSADES